MVGVLAVYQRLNSEREALMARRNPGQRQRKMFAEAKRLYELGRSEVATKVAANLAELRAIGPIVSTPGFRQSLDSTVAVQVRCKRDGYQSVRYCGALGSGAGKPTRNTATPKVKQDRGEAYGTRSLRSGERTAFIQEHSVDGKFVAPKNTD